MKKRILLEETSTPDGKTLSLYSHDRHFYIYVDGAELMSTRRFHSEERLAAIACAHLKEKAVAKVLIGGLGCGFTLREALKVLRGDAQIIVCEIMPAVVAWNRNPEYGLGAKSLSDPRVTVLERDVYQVLEEGKNAFDAVMLDVDNGMAAMTVEGNKALYVKSGVERAVRSMTARGRIVYWSANEDNAFADLLVRCGLDVKVERVRSHATSGPWHYLYAARKL